MKSDELSDLRDCLWRIHGSAQWFGVALEQMETLLRTYEKGSPEYRMLFLMIEHERRVIDRFSATLCQCLFAVEELEDDQPTRDLRR